MNRLHVFGILAVLFASGLTSGSIGAQAPQTAPPCAGPVAAPANARWPAYLKRGGLPNAIVFVHSPKSNAVDAWKSDAGSYWPALAAADRQFAAYDVFVHEFYAPGRASLTDMNALVRDLRTTLAANQVFEGHRRVAFVVEAEAVYLLRAYLLRYPALGSQVPVIFVLGEPSLRGAVSDGMDTLDADAFTKTQDIQWQALRTTPRFHCAVKVGELASRTVARAGATQLCSTMPLALDGSSKSALSPLCFDDPVHAALQRALVQATVIPDAAGAAAAAAAGMGSYGAPGIGGRGQGEPSGRGLVPTQAWVGRPVTAASRSINVGCDQVAEGTLLVPVPIDPARQEIVSAVVSIEGVSNLKQGEASVRGLEPRGVVVAYRLVGLDRVLFNCAGGGHGHVSIVATVRDK